MRDAEFTEYVTAKALWLRKVAFLLCGDWHAADDLVQNAITKLYTKWHHASKAQNIDGYARTILVNTFLAEQRSPWTRWVVLRNAQDQLAVREGDIDAALDLRVALAALPSRQRATVVLRYFCDLSVDETAQTMGCSSGNVKSQTARGITTLRRLLQSSYAASPEEYKA
ncbi:SigE family RNA polymerase sigma factor [Planotetraspora sp. A-T 1434]|uniref:SigE family RNA polymerase sigma factor n=1 Tax=Planotetraspora sp. A-T 1434 TaxID=2979219 RepID=UPI0021BEAE5F|nr:SigE family RNA polymerase sigma factor [Planotetraspora sp. A-T 1434]MCT9932024.1 SigE family RNA polymerase sigma factor [Planotetraspora sp. A-T 1434]